MANQGGSHEQHVKAGQQSHKNTQQAGSRSSDDRDMNKGSQGGSQGNSHEQHVKAGQQSHKNDRH